MAANAQSQPASCGTPGRAYAPWRPSPARAKFAARSFAPRYRLPHCLAADSTAPAIPASPPSDRRDPPAAVRPRSPRCPPLAILFRPFLLEMLPNPLAMSQNRCARRNRAHVFRPSKSVTISCRATYVSFSDPCAAAWRRGGQFLPALWPPDPIASPGSPAIPPPRSPAPRGAIRVRPEKSSAGAARPIRDPFAASPPN